MIAWQTLNIEILYFKSENGNLVFGFLKTWCWAFITYSQKRLMYSVMNNIQQYLQHMPYQTSGSVISFCIFKFWYGYNGREKPFRRNTTSVIFMISVDRPFGCVGFPGLDNWIAFLISPLNWGSVFSISKTRSYRL